MPAVLYASTYFPTTQRWIDTFAALAPDIELRIWPEIGDPAEIDVVLGWSQPKGTPRRYPNLLLIQALGAGIDHILNDPERPPGVKVARLIDISLTTAMSEYVVTMALRYHRQLVDYGAQQQSRVWKRLPAPEMEERRVGVLGLGALGLDAAQKLAMLGFPVMGWSRGPKTIEGIETFHGEQGLAAMLARTNILVCLLPLTEETRGIVDARRLAMLPRGAFVINSARGAHVVEPDLLAALDSGQVAHATLDVFAVEPLPDEHPFWTHPRVTVTPHAASITNPATAVPGIVDNIRRARAGLDPVNMVDPARGY